MLFFNILRTAVFLSSNPSGHAFFAFLVTRSRVSTVFSTTELPQEQPLTPAQSRDISFIFDGFWRITVK